MIIALRASTGYVTAENGGELEPRRGLVTANRSQIGAWERWKVEPNGDGIALKSANGYYLCAEGGGGSSLYANRAKAQSWERFVTSPLGITDRMMCNLLASNGNLVSVSPSVDHALDATGYGTNLFVLEVLEDDAPQLSPLHADGWEIRTDDGARYVHRQATNYLLFQRYMEGQDIDPLLYDGFDGYNVTFLMKTVPEQAGFKALTPENYPDLYTQADSFVRYVNGKGKRIEATLVCDNDKIGYGLTPLTRHTEQMYDVLRSHPSNLCQLANEWEKNGINIIQFAKPDGVFASRGSSLAGGPCPLPAWDYSTAHLSRSGGGAYLDAQPYYMIAGYPNYAGTHGPVITNETRGASQTENSDRRTTDPSYFRRIASAMRGYSGGTFHGDDLIHSRPMSENIRKCADAFVEGMR